MRCSNCHCLVSEDVEFCSRCEAIGRSSTFKTFVSGIKSSLGFHFSNELVTLSIEEPEPFFTGDEIDALISEEKMVPLETKDVPHWEIMFFTSKRIHRPKR